MKQPTIFIIDHKTAEGNYLKYQLLANKLQDVHIFPTQEECIYRIRKDHIPDIIITDTSANTQNDIDFLDFIKKINSSVKVIFFSMDDNEEQASMLLLRGATDYIVKNEKNLNNSRELISNLFFIINESAYPK
jgi:DNA-binding NarL/FixJ family response regulator